MRFIIRVYIIKDSIICIILILLKKAIRQRNKIYKSSKDIEIKFLEGTNVSYASVYATLCHVLRTDGDH